MYPVAHDLKFAARLFWKAPWFSVMALVALGLGMGATTAIFSVVDAVLLRPLPFREPDRLLVIWEKNPAQNKFKLFVAAGNFREWRQQSRSLEGMAAIQDVRMNLTGGPHGHIDPEELHAQRISAELTHLLGVQPAMGRAFLAEEDQPGNTKFVMLSHRLWERRFGSDPSMPGKSIQLLDQNYTVVGVLPAGFSILDSEADLWLPLGLDPSDTRTASGRSLTVVARLKPGTTVEQARAEMAAIGNALEQSNPSLNAGWAPSLFVLRNELLGTAREALLVLLAAVGFLLLMACANVANLLLSRAATRRKEIAIRNAMGASRGRLLVQLFSESLLLALASGALGILLARVAVAVLVRLGPASIPRLAEARVDARLFLFAFGISVATGLLFGMAPAFQVSSGNLNTALTEGGRGGTSGRRGRRTRSTLVVAEVALSVVVLIGAGLLIRSFLSLRAANPGFQPGGVLTLRLPVAGGRYGSAEKRIAFFQQVTDRIAMLPGVRTVGAANSLPLTGFGVGAMFRVDGRPAPPPDQRPLGLMRAVTPPYFRTLAIPLMAGREFVSADTAQSTPVVIINQTLARRFWPQGNSIGGRLVLGLANGRVAEIVGVVGDVKPDRIEGEEWPTIYSPYPQFPTPTMAVAVRTAGPPMSLASAVQREVHQLDPDQPVADVRPMESLVDQAIAGSRFNAVLLSIFAAVAFILAAVGIYGVIAYDVNERSHEIGLRMALGAQSADVLKLVLGQGARLAAAGIAVGLVAAFVLTRLMATMLYTVKATDAYTFAAISLLLGGVALAASYLPSRRAMALDPVTALRHE